MRSIATHSKPQSLGQTGYGKCFLCSSEDLLLRRDTIRYGQPRNVLECRNCGLVFLSSNTSDMVVDYYKKESFRNLPRKQLNLVSHNNPNEIFSGRLDQAKRRFSMIRPHLKSSGNLLEIGCSAGSFISVVKEHVSSCTGVELDPTFAEFTRNTQKINVLEVALQDLLEDKKFDSICMWHVLEHLEDPIAGLKKLGRLLSDDGILFIEVPNVRDPLLTLYKIKRFEEFYYQEPHLYYFSPETLNRTFGMAKWLAEIIPVQIYGLLNHLRWLVWRRPQPNQPKSQLGFMRSISDVYNAWLCQRGSTDTIFAIARKKDLITTKK